MIGKLSRLFKHDKTPEPICSAVVAAAGSSRRMGGENKLLLPIDGIPVLVRTLLVLESAQLVDEIVIATREEDLLTIGDLCKHYGIKKPVKIVCGGDTRQESVLAAALECRGDAGYIAVHDGARPLVTADMVDSVIRLAHKTNAAALAVPVKDTIKVVRDGKVISTPARDTLRAIQTPQVFDAQLLRAALQSAVDSGEILTDDCAAVERLGKEVYLEVGSYENIKITTPEDIALAEELLRRRREQI